MICQTIPGMVDNNTEFFCHLEELHQVQDGSVSRITDFPAPFAALLDDAIANDVVVRRELDKLNLTDAESRRRKFFDCNYAGCDTLPDMTGNGKLGPREYVPCAVRGVCKHEGLLCKMPCGLSKRERDVIKEIGSGLLDKEICVKLNIKQDTLRTHKDHISMKTGEMRKTSLGVLAHKLNII